METIKNPPIMKTTIKQILSTTAALFALSPSTSHAQVVMPTTPEVTLFCDGTPLDLGNAPAGTEWIVRYSEEPTDTPNDNVTLSGNTIPAATLVTGYYYVSYDNPNDPEVCESEMLEMPIYKFAPLSITFTASDYCIEDASTQTFEGDLTSTDAYDTFAYQWYTVDGGTETAIDGATTIDYNPDPSIQPGTTTNYRLKAGYLVGALRYCSTTYDMAVTVTAKPGTPTISIEGATGESW